MAHEDEDEESGLPIEALAQLDDRPSPVFLGRIRGSIRRRQLASQAAELSWTGLMAVLSEYLRLLIEALGSRAPQKKEGEHGRDPQEPR